MPTVVERRWVGQPFQLGFPSKRGWIILPQVESRIGGSSVAEGSAAPERQGAEDAEVGGEAREAQEAEARNSR